MFEIQNLQLDKHHHRGEINSRKWGANVLLAAIEPLSLHKQSARDVRCGDEIESSSNSHSRVQIVTSRLQLVQSCQKWGSAVCLGENETTKMMMKIFHGSQCLRQRIRRVSSSLDVWKFEWKTLFFSLSFLPFCYSDNNFAACVEKFGCEQRERIKRIKSYHTAVKNSSKFKLELKCVASSLAMWIFHLFHVADCHRHTSEIPNYLPCMRALSFMSRKSLACRVWLERKTLMWTDKLFRTVREDTTSYDTKKAFI